VFQKKEFKRLRLVGQFNKGFIIAVLGNLASGSLFILDQHACDERHNLEKFQRELRIDTQCLLKPICTEVSILQANLLLKYEWIFSANGIRVQMPKNFIEQLES